MKVQQILEHATLISNDLADKRLAEESRKRAEVAVAAAAEAAKQLREKEVAAGIVRQCSECASEFRFDLGEQDFYKRKTLKPPRRCHRCRFKRRLAKETALQQEGFDDMRSQVEDARQRQEELDRSDDIYRYY